MSPKVSSASASADPPHPALWHAHQLGRAAAAVRPSGFDVLDAQLPGGGWPHRALTELLLAHPGVGEVRLLAPALARAGAGAEGAEGGSGVGGGSRAVMLIDPPALPCAQALAQLGLDTRRIVVVHGREGPRAAALRPLPPGADLLWALEQALRSGHLDAALAWLPDRVGADALRRLQLAAQAHDGPVFLLRGIAARLKPSPAPLRLALHGSPVPDELVVQVLKRRGPPLAQPLRLVLAPVLSAPAKSRALERLVVAAVDASSAPLPWRERQMPAPLPPGGGGAGGEGGRRGDLRVSAPGGQAQ